MPMSGRRRLSAMKAAAPTTAYTASETQQAQAGRAGVEREGVVAVQSGARGHLAGVEAHVGAQALRAGGKVDLEPCQEVCAEREQEQGERPGAAAQQSDSAGRRAQQGGRRQHPRDRGSV